MAISAYSDMIISQGPVAYWRMGDPQGVLLTDDSGNGHTADAQSAVNPTAQQTGAIDTDPDAATFFTLADSQFYEWNNGSWFQFDHDHDFAILFWIFVTGIPLTEQCILSTWDLTATPYPFEVRLNTLGNPTFWRYDGSNNPQVLGDQVICDGGYHMVACVKSGSELQVYIDGGDINFGRCDRGTDTTSATTTNAKNLQMGRRGDGSEYAIMRIDEVALFDKALTADFLDLLFQKATQQQVGGRYCWRARFVAPWGYFSPWSDYDCFGVTGNAPNPICMLDPLPAVIWEQPLCKWNYSSAIDSAQMHYELWIATDVNFSNLVYDSGWLGTDGVPLPVYQQQASGLSTGQLYYRRLQVGDMNGLLSEYSEDSFTFEEPTTQQDDFTLYRRHSDGSVSQLYVPVKGLTVKRRMDGPSEMTLTMDEFAQFVEYGLKSCYHFDECAGNGVAHDLISQEHLVPGETGHGPVDGHFTFTTNQYAISGNLNWTLGQDFTCYLAIFTNGSSGTIWSLAAYGSNSNYYAVEYASSGHIRIKANGSTSAGLVVPANTWVVLELLRSSGTLFLTRLDTAASVSLATPHPVGNARHGVGAFVGSTVGSYVNALSIAGLLLYDQALGTDQRAQNYIAFQRFLDWRGITV